jgi:hypothetical protein
MRASSPSQFGIIHWRNCKNWWRSNGRNTNSDDLQVNHTTLSISQKFTSFWFGPTEWITQRDWSDFGEYFIMPGVQWHPSHIFLSNAGLEWNCAKNRGLERRWRGNLSHHTSHQFLNAPPWSSSLCSGSKWFRFSIENGNSEYSEAKLIIRIFQAYLTCKFAITCGD